MCIMLEKKRDKMIKIDLSAAHEISNTDKNTFDWHWHWNFGRTCIKKQYEMIQTATSNFLTM